MSADRHQRVPARQPHGNGEAEPVRAEVTRGTRWPGWRLGAVLVLLVLAVAGARSRAVTHLSSTGIFTPGQAATGLRSLGAPVRDVLGALLVTAAVLAPLLAARSQRSRSAGPARQPVPWWVRWLAAAIVIVAVILAGWALGLAHRLRHAAAHHVTRPRVPNSAGTPPATGSDDLALLVVLAALAVAGAAWAWWRLSRRAAREADTGADAEPSALATAVAAGSSALGDARDAREAIIACYAAMEDALAGAGSPRRPADTPEDLLHRAVAQGTVGPPAAGRLTALFREARFSPHVLGDADRDDARAALEEISAGLASEVPDAVSAGGLGAGAPVGGGAVRS